MTVVLDASTAVTVRARMSTRVLVQGFELGDELAAGGDPLRDDRVTDSHAGQEFHGPAGAEGPTGAALDEQAQHGMEATHAAGALGGELVVAVRQQPQHDAVFAVGAHGVQRGVAKRDDGSGAGVVGVGLVDPAVVHQPGPGRELRGYIDDVFAGPDELGGQERTHASGALDRPPAGLEPSGPLEEPGALMTVGGNA